MKQVQLAEIIDLIQVLATVLNQSVMIYHPKQNEMSEMPMSRLEIWRHLCVEGEGGRHLA